MQLTKTEVWPLNEKRKTRKIDLLNSGFSTEPILLVMVEKMNTAPGNKQFDEAILTNCSKSFDCICYKLLVGKLNLYGFNKQNI